MGEGVDSQIFGGEFHSVMDGYRCRAAAREAVSASDWSESFTAVSPSDRCDRNRSFDWPRLICRLYHRDQASDQHLRGSGLERPVELAANWHCRPIAVFTYDDFAARKRPFNVRAKLLAEGRLVRPGSDDDTTGAGWPYKPCRSESA